MEHNIQQGYEEIEFDDETMAALIDLGELLREIHKDLVSQGFVFTKDEIIPPPGHPSPRRRRYIDPVTKLIKWRPVDTEECAQCLQR